MDARALIDHLNGEITVFKEFVTVLQKETEDLVARDYRALYDTVSRKEHLILKMEFLGTRRASLLKEAARAAGITAEPCLSAIIEWCKGQEREELKKCQATLNSIIDSVREINRVNSIIVQGSVENIKKTLGFLGNFMPSANYKPSGSFEGMALKGTRLSEGA